MAPPGFLDGNGLEDHIMLGGGVPVPLVAAGDPVLGANGRLVFPLQGGAKAFAKGNRAGQSYCCANEWVTASVGLLAGFPLLPISQLEWDGILYVAWPYLDVGEIHLGATTLSTPEFISAAGSGLVPYQAAALDAWCANPDRHDSGNVIVVRHRPDVEAAVSRAFLHDHDRACFYLDAGGGSSRLRAFASDVIDGWDMHVTAWLREDATWRDGVIRRGLLGDAIARCRSVSTSTLKAVVRTLPPTWCLPADCAPLLRFLLVRQRKLATIIAAREDRFPNLEVAES